MHFESIELFTNNDMIRQCWSCAGDGCGTICIQYLKTNRIFAANHRRSSLFFRRMNRFATIELHRIGSLDPFLLWDYCTRLFYRHLTVRRSLHLPKPLAIRNRSVVLPSWTQTFGSLLFKSSSVHKKTSKCVECVWIQIQIYFRCCPCKRRMEVSGVLVDELTLYTFRVLKQYHWPAASVTACSAADKFYVLCITVHLH